VLVGRRVLHIVDNTSALSRAVHGYANEPDMANITNSLHMCDAMLGVDSWWEWVPSKANVADLPVRDPPTWDGEARGVVAKIYSRIDAQGFGRRELRLPTSAQLGNPAEMLRGVRMLAAWVAAGSLSNYGFTTSAQAPSSSACHPRSPLLRLRLCGGGPIQHA